MESSSSLSNTDRNRTYDYMARSEPTRAELPTGSESTGSIGAKYKLMSPAMLPISRSSCITIPPGLSPTSFLESPVLLSNMKAEASPTTGSYNQILGGFSSSPTNLITTMNLANNNSTDEEKSSFFEFKPHFRANMVSADMNNKKNEQSMQVQVQDQAHPFSSSSSMLTSEMLVPSVTVDPTEFEEDEFDQRLNKISGINSSIAGERPNNDGYNWRKYGQKHVKGCEFPRSYYKCTHPNCEVKKLFERSHDGQITDVVYKGAHDHPKPQSCSSTRVSIQEEDGKPEDSRVLANDDSNLDEVDNYDPFSKRRKMENSGFDVSTMVKPIREPRVVVQTLSEVDILDDGYRWRKYGQKVVRGNPNPRSYYKCTNVGCSVRKHVERASHDPKAVITTYEGKHNHDVPIAKTSSHDIAAGPSRFRSEESEAISLNLGVGIHTAAQNRSNDYRQSLNYVVSESETRESHFDFKVTQANTVSAHANVLNRGMNYREGHGIEITPLSHSSYPYTLSMGRIISGP